MLMINEYYVLLNIKSTIKYSTNGCTGQAVNPQYIAKNLLNREFTTDALNEKRLTDVTEFHYYNKIYLQIAYKLPVDNLPAGKILYFFNCLLDRLQFTLDVTAFFKYIINFIVY